jgi:hypothetical protein
MLSLPLWSWARVYRECSTCPNLCAAPAYASSAVVAWWVTAPGCLPPGRASITHFLSSGLLPPSAAAFHAARRADHAKPSARDLHPAKRAVDPASSVAPQRLVRSSLLREPWVVEGGALYTFRNPGSRDDRTTCQPETKAGHRLRLTERGILGLQRSVGNATVTALFGPAVIQRADVHTDKQLFQKMEAFRENNKHFSTEQQNKIFWSIKSATGSDEVAYTFFDYYSGYFGQQILLMKPEEEKEARSQDRLAKTQSGGDTKIRSDVLALPNERLGPLLLHEFAHTGHHTNFGGAYDTEEGQAYGVEYFYAERTGDTARMEKILAIISLGAIVLASQRAALTQNFKVTYALMKALDDLTKTGSSALPPLAGKNGNDGRIMAAQFVSNFRELSKDLQPLWDHIRNHLASFTVPVL